MYTTAISNCYEQVQAMEGGVFRLPIAVATSLVLFDLVRPLTC